MAARTGPMIMGVLNITPDSFSDGGAYLEPEAALEHARGLVALGADLIDVGGESTRPGAVPVPRDEELRRVLPVVRALADEGIAVSIDTIHAETAQAAVAAGARYINDVSGGLHDPGMFAAAAWASAEHGARYIISHWRGIPDTAHERSHYDDVVAEVRDALAGLAREAIDAGVDPAHIIVDPGLGFDKTGAQSWELLNGIGALASLGYPVLIGASRKRMIAEALRDVHGYSGTPEERDLATATASALAARAGVWGVRVHDVGATVQALAVERAWGAPRRADAPGAAQTGAAAGAGTASGARHGRRETRDRIALTGLEVFAHHGVFEFEREQGQRFLIDAAVTVDLEAAAANDELGRTVHYGELAEAIVADVSRDPVDLIETVAERVAATALRFPGVIETEITVHKPEAPIDAVFADVSVTVVRRAEEAR
ncbi:dihydropteroate synthase [Leucobacter sp. gxy201]|uniref:dihydropteroate synthase n=1 Tax=Leucobacter sp. gxy201 TaxID=2957200 RepID=UPI003DA09579